MKTVGIVPNLDKDVDLKYTRIVVERFLSLGGKVNLVSGVAQKLGMDVAGCPEESLYQSSEAIICLGGDGTFLKVARKAYSAKIPILGINLGSLGFLTEVEKSDIEKALECVINDNFTIEERIMLDTSIKTKDRVYACDVALNDIVISRGALSRILHLKTYINDVFTDAFPGDGLIVSSPTGSTAYSLSAGGPIVDPDLDIIIMTPICPHILYSRSFITAGNRVVKVVVDENYCHDAMVTVDGQTGYEIKGGYCVEIRKSPYSVKLIRIGSRNFFNILRTKIYERGEDFRE